MSNIYRNILVPLDGSELASRALPYAQEIATLAGAKLTLLRVVPEPDQEYQMTSDLNIVNLGLEEQQATMEHATGWVERLAGELKTAGIQVAPIVEMGEAAARIVDYAGEHDIDVIVMSTHGRTGPARWLYGSVASKVLAAAPCPVLLVRAQV